VEESSINLQKSKENQQTPAGKEFAD